MEEELTKPNDVRHLEQEISRMGEQHLRDLERLYTFHAEEYYDECVDRYLAKDDTQVLAKDETHTTAQASYKKLEVHM
jgi:rRNA-processing protein FCF1